MSRMAIFALLCATALVGGLAACGGGGGEEDADVEDAAVDDAPMETDMDAPADRQDVPADAADEDTVVHDIEAEDTAVEEIPAEVEETVDMADDEATPDDAEEEEIGMECAHARVACGDSLAAETTEGAPDTLDGYGCIDFDESGGEMIYQIVLDEPKRVTVINEHNSFFADLDLFVLKSCSPFTCFAFSTGENDIERVTFAAEAGVPYYVVVDGYDGSEGGYAISFTCTEVENCGDGVDNDGDGLIDCWDVDCREELDCVESACDDEADNDGDGQVDCGDRDCSGTAPPAPNCFESSCSDDEDNDDDGDTDCEDWDCLGAGACVEEDGSPIGEECEYHDDCATGQCIMETEFGWPAGACSVMSSTDTCATLTCPGDSICMDLDIEEFGGPWACLENCIETQECRDGYDCIDIDYDASGDVCAPDCDDDDQCVETGACAIDPDFDIGICVPALEECTGGMDEDGDGLADCEDPDCMFIEPCHTPLSPEEGDGCDEAVSIPLPEGDRGIVSVIGDTEPYSDDYDLSCVEESSWDVVYTFTLTIDTFVRIDLIGGRFEPRLTDTVLALRQECDGFDLLCNDDFIPSIWWHSRVEAMLAAGAYTIIVDGYDWAEGTFVLGMALSDGP